MAIKFPLPGSEQLRSMLRGLDEVLSIIARWTATSMDDLIASGLDKILSNDAAWELLYNLLSAVWPQDDVVLVSFSGNTDSRAQAIADAAGLDLDIVLQIIQAVLAWLQRRRG